MLTKYVCVLPYVYEPYFQECMETVKFPEENMLIIDNTVNNVGIMRAHNMGVERMYEVAADWMIILSAAVRFGEPGGLDFIDVLEAHPDHYIIHAASNNVKGGLQNVEGQSEANAVFGWHLTAFNRSVFDAIGVWDESFSPYGLDDIDLSIRVQKHFKGVKNEDGVPLWNTYPIDVHDTTMGHSINFANVVSPYHPRNAYFIRKWGRDGGGWDQPAYDHPFNDPNKGLGWWPKPEDPLSIQNVEYSGAFREHRFDIPFDHPYYWEVGSNE